MELCVGGDIGGAQSAGGVGVSPAVHHGWPELRSRDGHPTHSHGAGASICGFVFLRCDGRWLACALTLRVHLVDFTPSTGQEDVALNLAVPARSGAAESPLLLPLCSCSRTVLHSCTDRPPRQC